MKSNHYFLLVSHTYSLSPSLTLAVATVGTSQLTDTISFQVPVSLLTSLKHGEFSQSGSGRSWYTMRQPLITGRWKLVDKFLSLLSIGGNSPWLLRRSEWDRTLVAQIGNWFNNSPLLSFFPSLSHSPRFLWLPGLLVSKSLSQAVFSGGT